MCFKAFQNKMDLETDRFFLWVPVLLGLGTGIYFALPFELPVWFVCLMIAFSLFCAVFGYRRQNIALLALFIVSAGLINVQIQTKYLAQKVSFPKDEQTLYLSGRVLKTDFSSVGQKRLWLTDVSGFDAPLKGIYRIGVRDKKALNIGSCVELTATVFPPSHPLLPNGYQFDRSAFYDGVSAIGYAETSVYEIDCENKPSFFSAFLMRVNRFRNNVSFQISKVLEQKEAAVFSTLLIGDRSLVPDELYEQYRDAGLAHFLSISGLHLGLIAGFAFFMAKVIMLLLYPLALYVPVQKIAAVATVFLTFLYLVLSGFAVPAERAFVMIALVCGATLFDREAISLRTVAFAAIVILCVQPYVLISASFQLSFAAVTALVAFYEVFKNKGSQRELNVFLRVFFYFAGVLAASMIATAATFIFAVYHFKVWSPYTLLGNVVATPFIVFLIMPMIFFNLLLVPFGLCTPMIHITGFLLAWLNRLTAFISDLPYAGIRFSDVPFAALVLMTIGGLWLCLWQKKWRLYGLILIGGGIVCCFFCKTPDILYSKDGKAVAFRGQKNELVIFSAKKNQFINQVWAQGYSSFQNFKTGKSMDEIGLVCDENRCVYQDIFEFDLKGNLRLNKQPLTPMQDLGGVIYVKDGKAKLQSVRKEVGFKAWNMY